MSSPYHHDYRAFDTTSTRSFIPESNTLLSSVLIAVFVGAVVLFKALESLGFPVWLWVHQLAQMSFETLGLYAPSDTSSGPEDSQKSGMQRRGSVLSSVFGLNSGSLLQKGVRGVTGALGKNSSSVPPGLGNWDNSCYQNSVIQGLASLPSLRDYLSRMTDEHDSLSSDSTNGALFDMISKLNDPQNHGQHFWIRGKLKSMNTFQQQDAQEYYSKILDALDKEVQSATTDKRRLSSSLLAAARSLKSSPPSGGDNVTEDKAEEEPDSVPQAPKIIPNPLDGLQAQRVGCISCGYSEGLSLIPFNCITVSLGGNRYGYDIRECLDEFTSLEYIEGVECAKCTILKLKDTLAPLAKAKPGSPFEKRLQVIQDVLDEEDFEDKTLVKTLNVPKKNWVQSTKSRQAVIARAPKSLVIHVNRSIFDEMTGMQYKNSAGVAYPRILDLGNWCLGSKPSGSQKPDIAVEEWPRDPRKSMLAAGEPITTSPYQYRLRAAITHFGTHGNGHYVCYRTQSSSAAESLCTDADSRDENPKLHGEQWWRFSDDNVYAISEEQAHQGNVFMLFYERIDVAPPTTQEKAESIAEVMAMPEDAPLPPSDISAAKSIDVDDALEVPLPDDDSTSDLISVEPSTLEPTVSSVSFEDENKIAASEDTPSPTTTIQDIDTEMSEADSEDAPSTLLTSDSETEISAPPTPKDIPTVPPHLMRTAGTGTLKSRGSRRSLPLVSAT